MQKGARHGDRGRRDDLATYEAMVETYHRIVYGIAMRTLGDATLAESVTETVFSELWTSGRLGEPETAGAWLVLHARRASIDVSRRSGDATPESLRAVELEDGFLGRPSDGGPWTRDAALEALAALSPEERTVLDLGYFEGLTYRQIAVRTGIDASLVKRFIRSGLDALDAASERSARLSGTKAR